MQRCLAGQGLLGHVVAGLRKSGGGVTGCGCNGGLNVDGSGERLLAKGFLLEGPTWSPNGRVLMYFKQEPFDDNGSGGETNLYRIDITGFNEKRIITPSDASDPAWSPILQ